MNAITRKRLAYQGFFGFTDEQLDEIGPWLRFAPGLCAIIALTGTALGSTALLWLLTPAALLTAVTGRHPFDQLYNKVFRVWLGRTRLLPLYGAPRRFSAGLAAVWLFSTGLAFLLGAEAAGTWLGLTVGGPLAIAAATDLCAGCAMYHAVMGIASGEPRPRTTPRMLLRLALLFATVGGVAGGLEAQADRSGGAPRLSGTSFLMARYKAGSTTSAYAAGKIGAGLVLAGAITNPTTGYRAFIAGAGTRIRLSASAGTLVALAGATATDGNSLRLYVLPKASKGTLLMAATSAVYLPLSGKVRRTASIDPLTVSLRLNRLVRAGVATVFDARDGKRPDFGAGPCAQLRVPGGTLAMELVAHTQRTGPELRGQFNVAL